MNYETTVQSENGSSYTVQTDGEGDTVVIEREGGWRSRRFAIIAVLAAIVLATAFYLLQTGGDEGAVTAPDESQIPVVSVISPGRATNQGTSTASGTRQVPTVWAL